MKLGIGSYAYTWAIGVPGFSPKRPMDAFALIDRVAALGAKLAQIDDNIALEDWSDTELARLATHARERGVGIEVGTRGIRDKRLGKMLNVARRLGSPIVRVVVDRGDHHPTPDEVVTLIRGELPAFESAGVTIAIENHDRFPARVLAGIIQSFASERVGICLDTVNSFGAKEGPEAVLPILGPLAVNLHIKDFAVIRASHHMGFAIEGRPAGKGQLDVPWVLGEMRRYGRDVNAILELWTPPGATIEASIASEDAWAVESMGYLRGLITE
jgi:3-oxoisoapionate decarboxylase